MGFLSGKRVLITGIMSNRSIAYGIAEAMHREGAEMAFTYLNESMKERTHKLVSDFSPRAFLPMDVASDEQIMRLRCASPFSFFINSLIKPAACCGISSK